MTIQRHFLPRNPGRLLGAVIIAMASAVAGAAQPPAQGGAGQGADERTGKAPPSPPSGASPGPSKKDPIRARKGACAAHARSRDRGGIQRQSGAGRHHPGRQGGLWGA